MSIFIRILNGPMLPFDINVNTTIGDIAEDIKDYIEHPKFSYQDKIITVKDVLMIKITEHCFWNKSKK